MLLHLILALTAPIAPQHPVTMTSHGEERIDNYAWMKDKENPETVAYLEEENAYASEVMEDTQPLQEELYTEMKGRVIEDDSSVPVKKGNYYYYTRYEKGASYPLHCRKKGSMNAPEEIFLDENALAGEEYFQLEAIAISHDQNLLAYAYDCQGNELSTLRIKDLKYNQLLEDSIYPTIGNLVFSSNGKEVFYLTADATLRPDKVWRHILGEPHTSDVLVFHEEDPKFVVGIRKSKDEKILFIQTQSNTSSATFEVPLDAPEKAPSLLLPKVAHVKASVESYGNGFFILTDENAPNYKVIFKMGNRECDFVEHRENVLIEDMELFCGTLVLFVRENFKQKVEIINIGTNARNLISFDEPIYEIFSGSNIDFFSPELRFHYSSPITPERVYDYNLSKKTFLLKKEKEIPHYCPCDYTSKMFFATACDGTKIPISLVWKKGCVRGVLLTGYGAYGASYPVGFSSARISLLDRGVAFAVAHIRGGQEGGRVWYEEGKFLKKKNTFTDFIAAAEELICKGIVTPDHLVIEGRSAGGLLIGAVVNMRPDLFKAAIAGVPFVDALNTMLDPTIPLTVNEYEEWGNPNEKEAYDYIKSYAPYENVEPKHYPALLITGGLNDPRVGFWEPAKWASKLRAIKTDPSLLILKTEMGGGHFGKSGRYDALREKAYEYAFILKMIEN